MECRKRERKYLWVKGLEPWTSCRIFHCVSNVILVCVWFIFKSHEFQEMWNRVEEDWESASTVISNLIDTLIYSFSSKIKNLPNFTSSPCNKKFCLELKPQQKWKNWLIILFLARKEWVFREISCEKTRNINIFYFYVDDFLYIEACLLC